MINKIIQKLYKTSGLLRNILERKLISSVEKEEIEESILTVGFDKDKSNESRGRKVIDMGIESIDMGIEGKEAFDSAIKDDDFEAVKKLIDSKVYPNYTYFMIKPFESERGTALDLANRLGRKKIASFLRENYAITYKFIIERKNREELEIAIRRTYVGSIKKLIDSGANLNDDGIFVDSSGFDRGTALDLVNHLEEMIGRGYVYYGVKIGLVSDLVDDIDLDEYIAKIKEIKDLLIEAGAKTGEELRGLRAKRKKIKDLLIKVLEERKQKDTFVERAKNPCYGKNKVHKEE